MNINTLQNRLKLRKKDESGYALVSAILIMFVVMILISAIMMSTMLSIKNTKTNRETLKAVAAAEAGRDSAIANLLNGKCKDEPYGYSEDPSYGYIIFATESTVAPKDRSDSNLEMRCPKAQDNYILIESSSSINNGAGNQKVVTSIYDWNGRGTGKGFLNSAIMINGNTQFTNGYQVARSLGVANQALVTVENGNFECFQDVKLNGNLTLKNGNVNSLAGCNTLEGDINANGYVNFDAGDKTVLKGSVCATGNVSSIESNLTGIVKANQDSCAGLNSQPGWVNYNPDLTGATVVSDVNICTNNKAAPTVTDRGSLVALIEGLETPTTLDATGCEELFIINVADNLKLKTDVTIVANKINIGGTEVKSADGNEHNFNLIIPDRGDEGVDTPAAPTCSEGQGLNENVYVNLKKGISGIIYSPCAVKEVKGNWTGQLYLGGAEKFTAGSLSYLPIPLNGFSIDPADAETSVPLIFPRLINQFETISQPGL